MTVASLLDELTFYADSGEVHRGDRHIALTPSEFDIFDSLHDAYPRFKSREAIFDDLYSLRGEAAEPEPKIIDIHLTRMRRKLREIDVSIENKWGFGWRLQIDPSITSRKVPS